VFILLSHHRDLKVENLLLDENRDIKIIGKYGNRRYIIVVYPDSAAEDPVNNQ
jgi:serine/threonine protein kinase